MIYHNDKEQTQGIKKFIKAPTPVKPQGEIPKDRVGTPSAPSNRHLPIRGQ